jgi:hypothetical protein
MLLENDRRQLWAIEESEEISTVHPAEGVTEAVPMNHGTSSDVPFKADRSHEN